MEFRDEIYQSGILRTINPNGIPPEKPDYLFRCFVAPGIFLGNHPKKSCFIYFPTGFSRNVLQTVNNQLPTKDQNSYKKGGGCHRMLSFSSLNFR